MLAAQVELDKEQRSIHAAQAELPLTPTLTPTPTLTLTLALTRRSYL